MQKITIGALQVAPQFGKLNKSGMCCYTHTGKKRKLDFKIFLIILIIMIATNYTTKTIAQYIPANIASAQFLDGSAQVIYASSVENTGTDIIRYETGSSPKSISATVWDGTAPKLAWQHIHSNTVAYEGEIALSANNGSISVYDPDVALFYRLKSGVKYMYALVCYRDLNSDRIYLEFFKYDFTNEVFNQINQVQISTAGTVNNNSVNIDSDQYEHFAVTWDHDDEVRMAAGKWNNTLNVPDLCNADIKLPLQYDDNNDLIPEPYTKPDVCVNANGADAALSIVNFSFLADNGKILVVSTQRLDVICNNPANLLTNADHTKYVTANEDYDWPRIACHKDNNAANFQSGYTVVYENHNSSAATNDICAVVKFDDFTLSTYVTTFTDVTYTNNTATFFGSGSDEPPFLNDNADYTNYKPVVTYDSKSGNLYPLIGGLPVISVIAWNHIEDATGDVKPISLYIENAYGAPHYTNGTGSSHDFNEVPDPITTGEEFISVAAEQSPNFQYIWFDGNNSQMNWKRRNPKAHLRLSNSSIQNATGLWINDFFIENYATSDSPRQEFTLCNIGGQEVIKNINSENLFHVLTERNYSILPGVYFLKGQSVSYKCIKF